MPLTFSVVTPSYNQGPFIQRTIDSVLSQEGVSFDYMICDGGSKDQTRAVLESYGDRLRWVSEPDGGQAAAVNKGIAATAGDIIAWINSDDVYLPSAFKKVQSVFEAKPEVNVVYGNACHIDCQDQIIETYPTEPWNYKRLKEVCFLCQPAVFFRRSMILAHGELNAALKFCMDYELWLRYGRSTDFYYLRETLAYSRFYADTKTLGQRLAVHCEINEMMKAAFGIAPEKWVLTYAHVTQDEQEKNIHPVTDIGRARILRIHGFCKEAFKGAWRWRHGRLSISTLRMMLGWLFVAYIDRFRERSSRNGRQTR